MKTKRVAKESVNLPALPTGNSSKALSDRAYLLVDYRARLDRIAAIIEAVDHRAMAADGPVTPTLEEMNQKEMTEIYSLAVVK